MKKHWIRPEVVDLNINETNYDTIDGKYNDGWWDIGLPVPLGSDKKPQES